MIKILAYIGWFSPLVGALIAGLIGSRFSRHLTNIVTIGCVGIAAICFSTIWLQLFWDQASPFYSQFYLWIKQPSISLGANIDGLSSIMLAMINGISCLIHIYSMGYMQKESGYSRFFAYVSLFTFAMNTLVLANNFIQLFFGWEGVGVASYLLIGFWHQKLAAAAGSLKAFLVNRVGDFGLLIAIALVFRYTDSFQYSELLAHVSWIKGHIITIGSWQVPLSECIALGFFIGIMGKSAQAPLHVWLPESMEGPTPISALIHAATMVTAGIYLWVRLGPLFAAAPMISQIALVIAVFGALFLGMIGLVQDDIKRVIAYSTLSQLGYMMAAASVSAYSVAIFHLLMHAYFKALLFLGAGAVIVVCHHEQDMRKMGGLWKKMPICYVTMLLGSLSLIAFPYFSGFFSKDAILDVMMQLHQPFSQIAYYGLLAGAFVTSLYSTRLLLLTFHGSYRGNGQLNQLHDAPISINIPLIVLSIPSVLLGWLLVDQILMKQQWLTGIHPMPATIIQTLVHYVHTMKSIAGVKVILTSLPFYASMTGVLVGLIHYWWYPGLPAFWAKSGKYIHHVLVHKFYFDCLNQYCIVQPYQWLSQSVSRYIDQWLIDQQLVNCLPKFVDWLSKLIRPIQSGLLYDYIMLIIVVGGVSFIVLLAGY
jgi:NADH-quinone oxidoreductase subunit L